jgi:hypothetical protein
LKSDQLAIKKDEATYEEYIGKMWYLASALRPLLLCKLTWHFNNPTTSTIYKSLGARHVVLLTIFSLCSWLSGVTHAAHRSSTGTSCLLRQCSGSRFTHISSSVAWVARILVEPGDGFVVGWDCSSRIAYASRFLSIQCQ